MITVIFESLNVHLIFICFFRSANKGFSLFAGLDKGVVTDPIFIVGYNTLLPVHDKSPANSIIKIYHLLPKIPTGGDSDSHVGGDVNIAFFRQF